MAGRPVPIDPLKLIDAAEGFANHLGGAGRPRPTWLRRAVSTAYYALFHALSTQAALSLLPNGTTDQRMWLARTFGHAELKGCCAWVAGRTGNVQRNVRPLVQHLQGTSIALVADSFCDLQEARHRADYDHLASFSKATTVAHIEEARRSIQDLNGAPAADREIFFALLAVRTKPQR